MKMTIQRDTKVEEKIDIMLPAYFSQNLGTYGVAVHETIERVDRWSTLKIILLTENLKDATENWQVVNIPRKNHRDPGILEREISRHLTPQWVQVDEATFKAFLDRYKAFASGL